jgi:Ricin-type beta-trefoil lectin domain-like
MRRKLPDRLKGLALLIGALPAAAIAAQSSASATTDEHVAAEPDSAWTMTPVREPDVKVVKVTWRDIHDNRYLQIYHRGKGNGDSVQAYPRDSSTNQHWDAINTGKVSGGGATLWAFKNLHSSKCLAVHRQQVNGKVVQWDCGRHDTYKFVEMSVRKNSPHHQFLGYLLAQTAVGQSPRVAVCEHESAKHLGFQGEVPDIVAGGPSLYRNCIWR